MTRVKLRDRNHRLFSLGNMFHAGVRDLARAKIEADVRQFLETGEPRIGELGVCQIQGLECGQFGKFCQSLAGDRRAGQVERRSCFSGSR